MLVPLLGRQNIDWHDLAKSIDKIRKVRKRQIPSLNILLDEFIRCKFLHILNYTSRCFDSTPIKQRMFEQKFLCCLHIYQKSNSATLSAWSSSVQNCAVKFSELSHKL